MNSNPYLRETRNDTVDSIHLLDLIVVFFKYKWLILLVAIVPGTVLFVYLRPPLPAMMYYSQCMIVMQDKTDCEKIKNIVHNNLFINTILQNKKIIPLLYPDQWLESENRWKNPEKQPSLKDTIQLLKSQLVVNATESNETLELGFYSSRSDLPPKFLLSIIDEFKAVLSEKHKKDMETVSDVIQMLKSQLMATDVSEIKREIAIKLVQYMIQEKELRRKEDVSFTILIPPVASKDKVPVGVNTSRRGFSKRFLLSYVPFLAIGIALAFCIEFVKTAKKNEPEKFAQLCAYMHLRRKS